MFLNCGAYRTCGMCIGHPSGVLYFIPPAPVVRDWEPSGSCAVVYMHVVSQYVGYYSLDNTRSPQCSSQKSCPLLLADPPHDLIAPRRPYRVVTHPAYHLHVGLLRMRPDSCTVVSFSAVCLCLVHVLVGFPSSLPCVPSSSGLPLTIVVIQHWVGLHSL